MANPQLSSDFNEAFAVELINSHFLFAAVATAVQDGTLVGTGLENPLFKTEKDSILCKPLCFLLVVCSVVLLQASVVITYRMCQYVGFTPIHVILLSKTLV